MLLHNQIKSYIRYKVRSNRIDSQYLVKWSDLDSVYLPFGLLAGSLLQPSPCWTAGCRGQTGPSARPPQPASARTWRMYCKPKITFLFSGATFHIPLTKSATLNRLLHCSLWWFSGALFYFIEGSFLHYGGKFARSPDFSPWCTASKNIWRERNLVKNMTTFMLLVQEHVYEAHCPCATRLKHKFRGLTQKGVLT